MKMQDTDYMLIKFQGLGLEKLSISTNILILTLEVCIVQGLGGNSY